MPVRRQVVDLGFCVAVISPNHSPDDPESHGAIILQITQPETDTDNAKSIEIWNHEGLINLKDAIVMAVVEREEEIELAMRRRGEDPEEMLKELREET